MPSITIQTNQGAKTINFTGNPPSPQDIDQIAQQNNWQPAQGGASSTPGAASAAAPAAAPAPTSSGPGYFSRVGQGLVQGSVGQEIIGMAKGIGQTATGIMSIPQNIANAVAPPKGGVSPLGPTISQQTSAALAPKGFFQGAGNVLEKGAELLTPTPEISAAKDVMGGIDIASTLGKIPEVGGALEKGVNAIKDVPYLGKALSYTTQKVLKAIPEAVFGTGYGLTQGQTPGQAVNTGKTFGLLSGLGEIAGDTWRAIKGGVADNINKALGMTNRKIPLSDATKTMPQRLNAFQTMAKLGDDIKVKTDAGVEKLWEPTKDGFYEGLQALQQTKQKIFGAYDELAKQAGDKGAQFVEKDFNKVIEDLTATQKNTTSAFVNKSKSLIGDLVRNYANVDEEGNITGWKPTPLTTIQDFIKKVNVDVNPVSDKAGAEVSDAASKSLRTQMEDKILSSTNKSWQNLRNTYKDLMSIEPDLMNQFRKVTRGSPGAVGKYVEGFGAIDTMLGFLEKNPIGMAKGVAMATLGKTMNYLKDPTAGLQEAFSQLLKEQPGALESRLVGKAPAPAPVKPKP